jgi:LuxR family transcriptional regulator, quorum-sensing system regulator CinR
MREGTAADDVKFVGRFSEEKLAAAYSLIDQTTDLGVTIGKLRDLTGVNHIVYHSSKFGASPSADPFIRLTYPDAWIKRYLQMGYIDVDPVIREGFLRILPFDWRELTIQSEAELAFLMDALAHHVGPYGYSIPVQSKNGHRALFSVSYSGPEDEWREFLQHSQQSLIQIAHRTHTWVMRNIFDEIRPHLTTREIECLRLISLGKNTSEIAVILSISPHTARDYLKSSRFKLDCVTSAQAVSKAVKLGLLIV